MGAARQAVSQLTAQGHRRIAHITEQATDGLARDLRIQGFRQGLAEAGISDGPVLETDSGAPSPSLGAELLAMEVLAGDERPTAIFAYTDLMALGVYRATHRLGTRIPDDLSIVGFDDQEHVASELSPGLTTMALPHYEMGKQATQALLKSITAGRPPHPETILVPCPVVERGSVAQALWA